MTDEKTTRTRTITTLAQTRQASQWFMVGAAVRHWTAQSPRQPAFSAASGSGVIAKSNSSGVDHSTSFLLVMALDPIEARRFGFDEQRHSRLDVVAGQLKLIVCWASRVPR